MLHLWGLQPGRDDRFACPLSSVTSDPFLVPWWAWQEVKGEAMAVNEPDLHQCDCADCRAGGKAMKV